MSDILNKTAVATRNQIKLTWDVGTAIRDSGGNVIVNSEGVEQFDPLPYTPLGYQIKRATHPDGQENAFVFGHASPTREFTDLTVLPGVEYFYFFDAMQPDGTFSGDYSAAVVITAYDIERVVIEPTSVPWIHGGTRGRLRFFAKEEFVVDGVRYRKGSKKSWFKEVPFTVSNGAAILPLMNLPPTTDSDNPGALITGYFVTSTGDFAGYYFQNWFIPHDLGDTATWTLIATANRCDATGCGTVPTYAPNLAQVFSIVSDFYNGVKQRFARVGKAGIGEPDTAPDNPLRPIFVGVNSPLLTPPTPYATRLTPGKVRLTKDGDEISAIGANESLFTEKTVFFEDYFEASKTVAAPEGNVKAAFDALLADFPNQIPGLASAVRRHQVIPVLFTRNVTIDFDLSTHYNLELAFTGEGRLTVKNIRDEEGDVIENNHVVIGRMALTGARKIFDVETGSSVTFANKAVTNKRFYFEWWTGSADEDAYQEGDGDEPDMDETFVIADQAYKDIRQSVINNRGGTVTSKTGNFHFYNRLEPSIGMILDFDGANSYGKKNPNNAGVSGAVGGGTNLIYKGDASEFIFLGDLADGADNTRTVQIKNVNIDCRGTNAVPFVVKGANQNIYGIRCEEVVFLNSAKYCFDINVKNAAQVEEVLFDHCEFITSAGGEGNFRCNTNNGTNLFTQCYFATAPNKDCLFLNKCGATTLMNCHLVGANTPNGSSTILEGRAGVYFGFIAGGTAQVQGVDITNFTMIGCQDEGLNYSIISEAFQVPHPSTLMGNLFQGNMLVRGRHVFNSIGNTYWSRAWRDTPYNITSQMHPNYARHPFLKDGGGVFLLANSRVYSKGDHFGGNRATPKELVIDPATRQTTYVDSPAWGQADKFDPQFSYSEVVTLDDPLNDIHYQRGAWRHWVNAFTKWKIFEIFSQNTPIFSLGTNQPGRAVFEIATTAMNTVTREEFVTASWKAWRDQDTGGCHWESSQKEPYNNFEIRGGIKASRPVKYIAGAYTINPVLIKSDTSEYPVDDNGTSFTCVAATVVTIPQPVQPAAAAPHKTPWEIEVGTVWEFTRHSSDAVVIQLSAAAIADGCALIWTGGAGSSYTVPAQYATAEVHQYYPKLFKVTLKNV